MHPGKRSRPRLDANAAATEALMAQHCWRDAPLENEIATAEAPARRDALRQPRTAASGCGRFWWSRARRCSTCRANAALLAGAALECIHCYSLIHDDLPSMDNSDLRRGRPTAHKAFDDATAILAGDALLTIAFDIITRDEIHRDATVRLKLTQALARAAGIGGMAGGQMLDLAGEGRFGDKDAA